MRTLKAASAAALMLFLLCGSAQTQSIANPIEGTWILQSLYEENDSGEELDRWGDKPTGRFIADAVGHFSFQLVGREAIRVGTTESSPKCSSRTDRESLAYTGAYLIDREQDRMKLHIEDATSAQWDQTHASVGIAVGPDHLEFVSSGETSLTGAFYSHLMFRRAN